MIEKMLNSRKEIERYVPHSGAMLLLDRVIEYGPEHIVVELDVGPHLPCYADGRVPAYLGIEFMAQSIAAWAGIRRGDPDSRPPIGFLVGTRHYESTLKFFAEGNTLKIRARRVVENDGLAMFECEIDRVEPDNVRMNVATANINVYSAPQNSSSNPP